jgi:hypothetical protein
MRTIKVIWIVAGILAVTAAWVSGAQQLRQSTQVTVAIYDFVDETDGITPIDNINFAAVDDCVAIKAGGTVVDISGNTWADIVDANGMSKVTLTTSNTDTLGPLIVRVRDADGFLPVTCLFDIVGPNYYDATHTNDEINVYSIGGSKTAADNMVKWYATNWATVFDDTNDVPNSRLVAISAAANVVTASGGASAIQTDANGYIKLSSGTGTGQISLASGLVSATIDPNADIGTGATAGSWAWYLREIYIKPAGRY